MSSIQKHSTPEKTATALANYIKNLVNKKENSFYLAVSGGSTPKMLFHELTVLKDEIEWEKLQLFWVDERMVPPTHKESNFKMTRAFLLEKVPIPELNIHRMKGELSPTDALTDYREEINKVPFENGLPKFDLIVLGMGDDGHTASIFPPDMHLLKAEQSLAIGTNPYSMQKRLTLTGKAINNASEVIFHVTGKNKAPVLDKILHKKGNYLNYPAVHIDNANTSWYIDESAFHMP